MMYYNRTYRARDRLSNDRNKAVIIYILIVTTSSIVIDKRASNVF